MVTDNNNDNIISNGKKKSGDCITDTPSQSNATYPTNNNQLVMFMNYMDYVDDDALFMFSNEQCYKIYICINLYRKQLVSSLRNANSRVYVNKNDMPFLIPYAFYNTTIRIISFY